VGPDKQARRHPVSGHIRRRRPGLGPGRSGTQLINTNSNRCLDATGPSSGDGTPLQIWDCIGGANQQWNVPS